MNIADSLKGILSKLFEKNSERHTSETYARLIWRGFKRNRLALFGSILLLVLFVFSLFAGYIAPNGETDRELSRKHVPPVPLHFFDKEGRFRGMFLYDFIWDADPISGKRSYKQDKTKILPIKLFASCDKYYLWGIVPLRTKLFGAVGGLWYPFGGDSQGRCVFSRIIYASRVSLSIALIGALLTVIFGTILGTASGYLGGWIDIIIQRIIEITISFPRIPLWMGLAAAIPAGWSPVKEFFLISLVLSILSWGGLARQIRGIVLSLRDSDFIMASKSYATSDTRIMFKHILPNILGVTVVNATIAIPLMILGETALSFLGLGLRPPSNSWGVLLKDAQSVQAINKYPWLLIPGLFVVLSILAFNFVGDGLRDAIDPYKY